MNSSSNAIITPGFSSGWQTIAKSVGSLFGFALAVYAMRFVPVKTTAELLGGGAAGLLVGLVPLYVARQRGRRTLAPHALLWPTLAGAAGGVLLATPVAFVFILLAMREPAR
ncbi:MAG TPA: hypothetical protein VFI52_14340 [Gemmatimonadaceae bacterium]|nr:hypothetical protein [Gemmatimonadaceae bacterium]